MLCVGEYLALVSIELLSLSAESSDGLNDNVGVTDVGTTLHVPWRREGFDVGRGMAVGFSSWVVGGAPLGDLIFSSGTLVGPFALSLISCVVGLDDRISASP